jgi:hypothetical protein
VHGGKFWTRQKRDKAHPMDNVTDRRPFRPLSPDEEQEFRATQAKYEAAYRNAGEPRALLNAFMHVWWAGQTLPRWLVPAIGEVITKSQTDDEAERFRERMRHVRRYTCVRDLRRIPAAKGGRRKWKYTKPEALDLAVVMLKGSSAFGARSTIEDSYDRVRKDLERRGRESEFFFYVDGGADHLIVDLSVDPS